MTGSLDLAADLTALTGAEYNPRHISADDLEALCVSIRTLGAVKPIIARNGTIVAGHQRTRAMLSMDMTRAPVFHLSADTTVYDEIRFNQLENGTSKDAGDEKACIIDGFDAPGWHVVDPSRGRANFRGRLAAVRDEICILIQRFGPWGGVVCNMAGEVIHAAQYALAAFLTGSPLTVHVLTDDKLAFARKALGHPYGVFSYDGLARTTYIQTLAQMSRLRTGETAKANKSTLYETMAIPYAIARPDLHYVDFGSGHGDYASAMRRRGLHFHDVELFRRAGGALDVRAINRMVDGLAADLAERGRYDGVVCDSVLNSVDSVSAEAAVMTTLNALAKVGGKVFFSGRPQERNEAVERHTKRTNGERRRGVEFVDATGLSAIFRSGHWFYQKFHRREDVAPLCARFGLQIDRHTHGGNSWQVEATKLADMPRDAVGAAFDFEFDMALGADKRLGRHHDMRRAYDDALAKG